MAQETLAPNIFSLICFFHGFFIPLDFFFFCSNQHLRIDLDAGCRGVPYSNEVVARKAVLSFVQFCDCLISFNPDLKLCT